WAPISAGTWRNASSHGSTRVRQPWSCLRATRASVRSEERRVGKGWRSRCDWSSDVCSSDLLGAALRGYVEKRELARLYQSAAALVVPSRYEGFGLPVLEAMASGQPVAAAPAPRP